MRRSISILCSLSLCTIPVAAFAAFATPAQVLQAVEADSSPKTVRAELHGQNGSAYVSLWVSGMVRPDDRQFTLRFTLDEMTVRTGAKSRLKGQMILTDGQFYLLPESAEGIPGMAIAGIPQTMNRWSEVPGDSPLLDMVRTATMQYRLYIGSNGDLYDVQRIPYAYGISYILTPKPGSDVGEMKVDANDRDEIQVVQADVTGNSASFALRAFTKAEILPRPYAVTAPVDALPAVGTSSASSSVSRTANKPYRPVTIVRSSSSSSRSSASSVRSSVSSVDLSMLYRPSRRIVKEQSLQQREQANQSYKRPLPRKQVSTLDNRGLSMGSKTAPVTIVEFTDMECPFCIQHHTNILPDIISDYVDSGDVRYVIRHYPLSSHEHARTASLAIECAAVQGRELGWSMFSGIDAAQEDLPLDEKGIWAAAGAIKGLDITVFNRCMMSEQAANAVSADIAAANSAGIEGTPTFFILTEGGSRVRTVKGLQSLDIWQKTLDALLK